MGAPLWTADEEEVFEKIIIPMSDYATGDHIKGSGLSWEDLAPIMQDELAKRGINKRKYTFENLFQHHYQRHGKRAKERNQLASQQPLSRATASGPVAPAVIRDATPFRSSRAGSATPSHLARLQQFGSPTAEMYRDRSAQTDVSIVPTEDTNGGTEIQDYASSHPLAPPYTSDNDYAVAHGFDSTIPTSNEEDMMDLELTQSHNKSQYQTHIEDGMGGYGDLNMFSKTSENRLTFSSGEYSAKLGSISSPQPPSSSQSSGRKKIIAPKRPYGSSPAYSQKRPRNAQSNASFGSTPMDQHNQPSPVVAQPAMSPLDKSKPPPMGSFHSPASSQPQSGKKGMSKKEAMAEVLRQMKSKEQSRTSASSSVPAPVQHDLQKSTLNSPIDNTEHDPFGPQVPWGRPESALSNSHTSVSSMTGTVSRRHGKAPLRSPPSREPRGEDPAAVEAAENMLALANKYSFQTSPGHSYRTLSPSQQSTPAGPMSASPLKFTTPTKDQRAYSQRYEPSPLQTTSNFNDYNSAKNPGYESEFAIDNTDSPSAGRGSSGRCNSSVRGSRNNPPVPPFNTGSPAVQSSQKSQPAAEKSFMGYDGPAPHTVIPNESIFKKRPAATEAPEDSDKSFQKRRAVPSKVQLASDANSPFVPSAPATLSSSNTETARATQAPAQKPRSAPLEDLFFEPGSPSPPAVDPKKRTNTGSATSEPSKPRKVVPEVALAYDTEKSRLPALPANYVPTLSPKPAPNRRSSRESRASSSVRSATRSPAMPTMQPLSKPATPTLGTSKAPSKRSSLAGSTGRPEDISQSAGTTDLNLFATTKPKERMNSAPAAPAEPEQNMTKAQIRREAERKASIAHSVAKLQERTGVP